MLRVRRDFVSASSRRQIRPDGSEGCCQLLGPRRSQVRSSWKLVEASQDCLATSSGSDRSIEEWLGPRSPWTPPSGSFGRVAICEGCLLYTSPSPRDRTRY